MLWNTKNEIPIGSGSRRKKSIGAARAEPVDVGSRNKNSYLKNAGIAMPMKAMPIGSHTGRSRETSIRTRWVPSTAIARSGKSSR
jgi:hypothetical protein